MDLNNRKARLYQPTKTAMQQGLAKTSAWVLEFVATSPKQPDPIMGWQSTRDMPATQLKLQFPSLNKALQYARKEHIQVEVIKKAPKKIRRKSYADNFK